MTHGLIQKLDFWIFFNNAQHISQRRKTREPGEKPAEASMDWKPNACTAPGPGIEPGLSGAQRWGRTATPPASPEVS